MCCAGTAPVVLKQIGFRLAYDQHMREPANGPVTWAANSFNITLGYGKASITSTFSSNWATPSSNEQV